MRCTNILAFAIAPGFTMTGMAEEYLSSRGGDKLLADIPLGKVADAEEVAEAIRWLASEAPPSLTGSTLDINGRILCPIMAGRSRSPATAAMPKRCPKSARSFPICSIRRR